MKQISILLLLMIGIGSCTEYEYEYAIDAGVTSQIVTDKNKLKSPEQYVSILHVDVFNESLSANEMYELGKVQRSIGDKELVQEVIMSNFFNELDVLIPEEEEMRENITSFIEETYIKFYLRIPTAIEKEFLLQYIENDPRVTPEHVYFAFATSNEYQYY